MRRNRIPLWAIIWTGYSAFGREFAMLGVPPLLIGEAYLGFGILANWRNWVGRFVNDCLRLRLLPVTIAMHLIWGMLEVARSSLMGYPLLEVIKNAAFNYYPLYVPMGIALGSTLTFPVFIRSVKLCLTLFAIRVLIPIEGGISSDFALLSLLVISVWPQLKGWRLRIPVLLLCLYPSFFVSTHGRGTMTGLIAGLIAIAVASRQRFVRSCLIAAGVTGILIIVGPMIPGPHGGGPPLDPVVQIARVIASDHPDFAVKLIKWRQGGTISGSYRDEVDNLTGARGTASWRQEIWRNALKSLKTPYLKLVGQGQASSMAEFTPDGQVIRTPHNIAIYAIYYTGYIGLTIFFLMLFAIWRTGTLMESPVLRVVYSSSCWCTLLVAISGNVLETPTGAIPFYLFQGVIIGLDRKMKADRMRLQLLSAEMADEREDESEEQWSPVAADRIGELNAR